MRRLFFILFTVCVSPLLHAAPGFQLLQAPDPGHKAIAYGLWYPTTAEAPDTPNTKFGHALAVDAPILGNSHPLVLISHGYSGWYGGHADLAMDLANAGYIVAAPSHTGNTFTDMSSSVDQWALDRPRHISKVIDHLLARDETRNAIDANRIGVYGFSAGGFTVLSLIGGVPDFQHAEQHCTQWPTEFVCSEGMIDVLLANKVDALPPQAWGHDPRIKAAAMAAPGLAFAYTEQSLANVEVPLQLWSAENDFSVPHATNAVALAEHLPQTPETHWVENATHFAFLIMPCRPAFQREDAEEYEMVCEDADGFDRRAFLQGMGQELTRFFDQSM
jgi:predicted dienelactone hydrolase